MPTPYCAQKAKITGDFTKGFWAVLGALGSMSKNNRGDGVKVGKFTFFSRFFCVDLYLPIGDLGGRGPSLGVLKRLPLIVPRKRQLLRTY